MFFARSTVEMSASRRASNEPRNAGAQAVNRRSWTGPEIWLAVAIFQLAFFSATFSAAGVLVDSTDFFLLPFLLYLALNHTLRSRLLKTPHLYLLIALGTILSLGHTRFALEMGWINSPVGAIYQLYRYAWKPLLFYPLVFVTFRDTRGLKMLLHVLMLMAFTVAIMGIQQGYSGMGITGPFSHKNVFGGFLLIPISLALALGVHASSSKQRLFYGSCFLVVLRALLFTGSRGAVVGWFASLLCFAVISGYTKEGRKKLPMLFLAALLGVSAIFAMTTVLNRGSSLSAYGEIKEPTKYEEGTLNWRMKERWPHFFQKVEDNPWLGAGDDADSTLGANTNTPHNAYLSIAVKNGVPALLLFLSFVVIELRQSTFVIRRSRDKWCRSFAAGSLSAVAGLCVHSLVDGVFSNSIIQICFWLLLAVSSIAAADAKNHRTPAKPLI